MMRVKKPVLVQISAVKEYGERGIWVEVILENVSIENMMNEQRFG